MAVRVLAHKTFRFQNPKYSAAQLIDAHQNGSNGGTSNHSDAFAETKIGEAVALPDWVKKDKMYEWAVKDGDILELAASEQVMGTSVVDTSKPKAGFDISQLSDEEVMAEGAKRFGNRGADPAPATTRTRSPRQTPLAGEPAAGVAPEGSVAGSGDSVEVETITGRAPGADVAGDGNPSKPGDEKTNDEATKAKADQSNLANKPPADTAVKK